MDKRSWINERREALAAKGVDYDTALEQAITEWGELKKPKVQPPAAPAEASTAQPPKKGFMELAEELAAAKRISITAAMSIVAKKFPELHQDFILETDDAYRKRRADEAEARKAYGVKAALKERQIAAARAAWRKEHEAEEAKRLKAQQGGRI